MRRFTFVFALCLSSLLFTHSFGANQQTTNENRNTLRVVVNGAPPYRIILHDGGTSVYTGIYIDILKEAARRSGIYLNFIEVPFVRALVSMELGSADVMLGPLRKDERELYMDYLEPALPKEDKIFFIKQGGKDIMKYEDLSNTTIGILAGPLYDPQFDQDTNLKKIIVPGYSNAFKMIKAGRIDAAIMPERQGDYIIKATGLKVQKTTFRFQGTPSYITFSKLSNVPELREKLVLALKEMKQDGSFDLILKTYR